MTQHHQYRSQNTRKHFSNPPGPVELLLLKRSKNLRAFSCFYAPHTAVAQGTPQKGKSLRGAAQGWLGPRVEAKAARPRKAPEQGGPAEQAARRGLEDAARLRPEPRPPWLGPAARPVPVRGHTARAGRRSVVPGATRAREASVRVSVASSPRHDGPMGSPKPRAPCLVPAVPSPGGRPRRTVASRHPSRGGTTPRRPTHAGIRRSPGSGLAEGTEQRPQPPAGITRTHTKSCFFQE